MNIYAICSIIFIAMGSLNGILGGLTLFTNMEQTFIMFGSGVAFLIIGGVIIPMLTPRDHQISKSTSSMVTYSKTPLQSSKKVIDK